MLIKLEDKKGTISADYITNFSFWVIILIVGLAMVYIIWKILFR